MILSASPVLPISRYKDYKPDSPLTRGPGGFPSYGVPMFLVKSHNSGYLLHTEIVALPVAHTFYSESLMEMIKKIKTISPIPP